jgi:hypothetical protein
MTASIQFIEQTIDRMQQAATANGATAGRDGAIVTISPDAADEVMISGDLHGHRTNFNKLRKAADLANHPRRHLIMQEVAHGGPKYDGGGCMSHAMLEDVAKLKVDFPERFHFLLSNHELSELTGYTIQKGGAILNLVFRMGVHEMYGPATDRVIESYHAFIASCPLAVRWDGAFACHSVPEAIGRNKFDAGVFSRPWTKSDLSPHGGVFELVWGRDYTETNVQTFAELVGANVLLCGHEPTDEGFMTPNSRQVIFDCCHTKAGYAVLPTNEPLNQEKVVARIQFLRDTVFRIDPRER